RLLENFAGEILVDADHESENGGSTAALAWITALRADPATGLWANMKWTDEGAAAVSGRRYRFVSAAWRSWLSMVILSALSSAREKPRLALVLQLPFTLTGRTVEMPVVLSNSVA
ncbi:MAG: hypothetical protein IKI47_02205, partial [Prevotella sp.]|nr:hypothetical protein [Prevotella sp.]